MWEQLDLHLQKNLDTDFTLFTEINSKCITDLNVKCKTIKILENLDDPVFGNDFFDSTSKAWSMKKITDKLGFVKTNFILCKRHNQENDKTSQRLGENMCKKYTK